MLRLQLPISTLPMIFPDCKILRPVISCAALLAVTFTCILLVVEKYNYLNNLFLSLKSYFQQRIS